jgi:lysine 2,3-aminomutase
MSEHRRRRIEPETLVGPLWDEDPMIAECLARSATLDEARCRLLEYLEELAEALRAGAFDLDRLEWSSALDAIFLFKNLLSPENETVAGFSTLERLWRLGRGHEEEEVASGFVDEFLHLFRAINGRSGIGRGWLERESTGVERDASPEDEFPRTGRRAAIERSRFLDGLAHEVWRAVAVHPSGLDSEIVRKRGENRRRILAALGATDGDWNNADWQARHVLKGVDGATRLQELVPLRSEEIAAVRLAVQYGIPWGITPYYLSLFDFESADRTEDGQVRSQVIPPLHTVRRMIEHRQDRSRALDFMRERDTSPADRITRRYPTVAVFKVCDTCPQICTYCQRNWEISDAMVFERLPACEDLDPALAWFAGHPGITDILLTGGDPLVLDDRVLDHLLKRIAAMDHVRNVRIGSRVPVTMPMRITEAFAERLGGYVDPGRRNLAFVTHVESAYEVTPELASAVDRLRRNGVQVYNQQVFTVETSRRFQAVANRVALRQVGIDPYYTFYTKGKEEHRDYLVPIARLLQERKEEARLLPGIFRTDEAVFNVPGLGKSHLRAKQDRELIAIRPDGRRVYLFHPWEKGIAPVGPWPYVDVSIREYLDRLAELGEDPSDYETIWTYY